MAKAPKEKPTFDYDNWAVPITVKTKQQNRRKTTSLFVETIGSTIIKKYPPVYTLREIDHWDYYNELWVPSAKKIYMSSVDEYSAAIKIVGSIEHWNRLLNCDWFINGSHSYDADRFGHVFKAYYKGLNSWREEHQDAQKSRALEMLYEQARQGSVPAIKALMAGQAPSTRGRPSKEEVSGERKKEARKKTETSSDAERLSKVINFKRGS